MYRNAKKVPMQCYVSPKTHSKIKALADERGIFAYRLMEAILDWAGEQNAESLFRAGVDIPIRKGDAFFPPVQDRS